MTEFIVFLAAGLAIVLGAVIVDFLERRRPLTEAEIRALDEEADRTVRWVEFSELTAQRERDIAPRAADFELFHAGENSCGQR
jgi:predicted nucleic acid-binding protein